MIEQVDPDPFPFAVAVDLVVLTVRDGQLQVLVIERGTEPFKGRLALPGGFVLEDEDLLDAAERELAEETGVLGVRFHLEQLGTYGSPTRDPRGRVISVVYLAEIDPKKVKPVAADDAAPNGWWLAGTPAGGALPCLQTWALPYRRARADTPPLRLDLMLHPAPIFK